MDAFRRPQLCRYVRLIAWTVLLGLGGFNAAANPWVLNNEDGTSYLEVGDAFARGDWVAGVNAYWSPLFPALISLFLRCLRPSAFWEFPVVHLAHFFTWVIALAGFEFLLRSMPEDEETSLPTAILGYGLFGWFGLIWIAWTDVTPDILVLAASCVASGLLLRISADRTQAKGLAAFGATLGLGYLAKASMFPMAFVYLLVGFFAVGGRQKGWKLVLIAGSAFLCLALPWIVLLSHTKGYWTFSDAGRLNYAWSVNGVEESVYWQGGPPESGYPVHPARRMIQDFPMYEFAKPAAGTFPPWYDPSYWLEGLQVHWDLRAQIRALARNLARYYQWFFDLQGLLIFAALLLGMNLRQWRPTGRQFWLLAIPTLAAFALYALIDALTRYLTPFWVPLWLGVFVGFSRDPKLYRSVALALALVLLLRTGRDVKRAREGQPWRGTENWIAAQRLHQMGVASGSSIGTIGLSLPPDWARMARVRIVADIPAKTPEIPQRLASETALQRQVIQAFASAGAKAVIARDKPWDDPGWQPFGDTGYYTYLLSPSAR